MNPKFKENFAILASSEKLTQSTQKRIRLDQTKEITGALKNLINLVETSQAVASTATSEADINFDQIYVDFGYFVHNVATIFDTEVSESKGSRTTPGGRPEFGKMLRLTVQLGFIRPAEQRVVNDSDAFDDQDGAQDKYFTNTNLLSHRNTNTQEAAGARRFLDRADLGSGVRGTDDLHHQVHKLHEKVCSTFRAVVQRKAGLLLVLCLSFISQEVVACENGNDAWLVAEALLQDTETFKAKVVAPKKRQLFGDYLTHCIAVMASKQRIQLSRLRSVLEVFVRLPFFIIHDDSRMRYAGEEDCLETLLSQIHSFLQWFVENSGPGPNYDAPGAVLEVLTMVLDHFSADFLSTLGSLVRCGESKHCQIESALQQTGSSTPNDLPPSRTSQYHNNPKDSGGFSCSHQLWLLAAQVSLMIWTRSRTIRNSCLKYLDRVLTFSSVLFPPHFGEFSEGGQGKLEVEGGLPAHLKWVGLFNQIGRSICAEVESSSVLTFLDCEHALILVASRLFSPAFCGTKAQSVLMRSQKGESGISLVEAKAAGLWLDFATAGIWHARKFPHTLPWALYSFCISPVQSNEATSSSAEVYTGRCVTSHALKVLHVATDLYDEIQKAMTKLPRAQKVKTDKLSSSSFFEDAQNSCLKVLLEVAVFALQNLERWERLDVAVQGNCRKESDKRFSGSVDNALNPIGTVTLFGNDENICIARPESHALPIYDSCKKRRLPDPHLQELCEMLIHDKVFNLVQTAVSARSKVSSSSSSLVLPCGSLSQSGLSVGLTNALEFAFSVALAILSLENKIRMFKTILSQPFHDLLQRQHGIFALSMFGVTTETLYAVILRTSPSTVSCLLLLHMIERGMMLGHSIHQEIFDSILSWIWSLRWQSFAEGAYKQSQGMESTSLRCKRCDGYIRLSESSNLTSLILLGQCKVVQYETLSYLEFQSHRVIMSSRASAPDCKDSFRCAGSELFEPPWSECYYCSSSCLLCLRGYNSYDPSSKLKAPFPASSTMYFDPGFQRERISRFASLLRCGERCGMSNMHCVHCDCDEDHLVMDGGTPNDLRVRYLHCDQESCCRVRLMEHGDQPKMIGLGALDNLKRASYLEGLQSQPPSTLVLPTWIRWVGQPMNDLLATVWSEAFQLSPSFSGELWGELIQVVISFDTLKPKNFAIELKSCAVQFVSHPDTGESMKLDSYESPLANESKVSRKAVFLFRSRLPLFLALNRVAQVLSLLSQLFVMAQRSTRDDMMACLGDKLANVKTILHLLNEQIQRWSVVLIAWMCSWFCAVNAGSLLGVRTFDSPRNIALSFRTLALERIFNIQRAQMMDLINALTSLRTSLPDGETLKLVTKLSILLYDIYFAKLSSLIPGGSSDANGISQTAQDGNSCTPTTLGGGRSNDRGKRQRESSKARKPTARKRRQEVAVTYEESNDPFFDSPDFASIRSDAYKQRASDDNADQLVIMDVSGPTQILPPVVDVKLDDDEILFSLKFNSSLHPQSEDEVLGDTIAAVLHLFFVSGGIEDMLCDRLCKFLLFVFNASDHAWLQMLRSSTSTSREIPIFHFLLDMVLLQQPALGNESLHVTAVRSLVAAATRAMSFRVKYETDDFRSNACPLLHSAMEIWHLALLDSIRKLFMSCLNGIHEANASLCDFLVDNKVLDTFLQFIWTIWNPEKQKVKPSRNIRLALVKLAQAVSMFRVKYHAAAKNSLLDSTERLDQLGQSIGALLFDMDAFVRWSVADAIPSLLTSRTAHEKRQMLDHIVLRVFDILTAPDQELIVCPTVAALVNISVQYEDLRLELLHKVGSIFCILRRRALFRRECAAFAYWLSSFLMYVMQEFAFALNFPSTRQFFTMYARYLLGLWTFDPRFQAFETPSQRVIHDSDGTESGYLFLDEYPLEMTGLGSLSRDQCSFARQATVGSSFLVHWCMANGNNWTQTRISFYQKFSSLILPMALISRIERIGIDKAAEGDISDVWHWLTSKMETTESNQMLPKPGSAIGRLKWCLDSHFADLGSLFILSFHHQSTGKMDQESRISTVSKKAWQLTCSFAESLLHPSAAHSNDIALRIFDSLYVDVGEPIEQLADEVYAQFKEWSRPETELFTCLKRSRLRSSASVQLPSASRSLASGFPAAHVRDSIHDGCWKFLMLRNEDWELMLKSRNGPLGSCSELLGQNAYRMCLLAISVWRKIASLSVTMNTLAFLNAASTICMLTGLARECYTTDPTFVKMPMNLGVLLHVVCECLHASLKMDPSSRARREWSILCVTRSAMNVLSMIKLAKSIPPSLGTFDNGIIWIFELTVLVVEHLRVSDLVPSKLIDYLGSILEWLIVEFPLSRIITFAFPDDQDNGFYAHLRMKQIAAGSRYFRGEDKSSETMMSLVSRFLISTVPYLVQGDQPSRRQVLCSAVALDQAIKHNYPTTKQRMLCLHNLGLGGTMRQVLSELLYSGYLSQVGFSQFCNFLSHFDQKPLRVQGVSDHSFQTIAVRLLGYCATSGGARVSEPGFRSNLVLPNSLQYGQRQESIRQALNRSSSDQSFSKENPVLFLAKRRLLHALVSDCLNSSSPTVSSTAWVVLSRIFASHNASRDLASFPPALSSWFPIFANAAGVGDGDIDESGRSELLSSISHRLGVQRIEQEITCVDDFQLWELCKHDDDQFVSRLCASLCQHHVSSGLFKLLGPYLILRPSVARDLLPFIFQDAWDFADRKIDGRYSKASRRGLEIAAYKDSLPHILGRLFRSNVLESYPPPLNATEALLEVLSFRRSCLMAQLRETGATSNITALSEMNILLPTMTCTAISIAAFKCGLVFESLLYAEMQILQDGASHELQRRTNRKTSAAFASDSGSLSKRSRTASLNDPASVDLLHSNRGYMNSEVLLDHYKHAAPHVCRSMFEFYNALGDTDELEGALSAYQMARERGVNEATSFDLGFSSDQDLLRNPDFLSMKADLDASKQRWWDVVHTNDILIGEYQADREAQFGFSGTHGSGALMAMHSGLGSASMDATRTATTHNLVQERVQSLLTACSELNLNSMIQDLLPSLASVSSVAEGPSLRATRYQRAWKLGQWDTILTPPSGGNLDFRTMISIPHRLSETAFDECLFGALCALHVGENMNRIRGRLGECRQSIASSLSTTEALRRVSDLASKSCLINDLELVIENLYNQEDIQILGEISATNHIMTESIEGELVDGDTMLFSSSLWEDLLTLRCSTAQALQDHNILLRSSARLCSFLTMGPAFRSDAIEQDRMPTFVRGKARSSLLRVPQSAFVYARVEDKARWFKEYAKLLWADHDPYPALNLLQHMKVKLGAKCIEDINMLIERSVNDENPVRYIWDPAPKQSEPSLGMIRADICLLLSSWLRDTRLESSKAIMDRYLRLAMDAFPVENFARGKAILELALFAEREMMKLEEHMQSPEVLAAQEMIRKMEKELSKYQTMLADPQDPIHLRENKKDLQSVKSHVETLKRTLRDDHGRSGSLKSNALLYLANAMEGFLSALRVGGHISQQARIRAIFRVIGLWMDNSEECSINELVRVALFGSAPRNAGGERFSSVTMTKLDSVRHDNSYSGMKSSFFPVGVFLPLVYQLASRLSAAKAQSLFQDLLQDLLYQMTSQYPDHCIWQLLALANGDRIPSNQKNAANYVVDRDKVQAVNVLLDKLSKTNKVIAQRILESKQLSEAYYELSFRDFPGNASEISMSKEKLRLSKIRNLNWVNIPTMTLLSFRYNVEKQGYGLESEDCLDDRWAEFMEDLVDTSLAKQALGMGWISQPPSLIHTYKLGAEISTQSLPYVCHFADHGKILIGVNRPKLIVCVGSDGRLYKQLVKGNDDLRQDAVMEQLFTMVNDLLRATKESYDRKLTIRTYRVLPLSPCSGVLQWVDNSVPLSEYLFANEKTSAHNRLRPQDMKYWDCRKKIAQSGSGESRKKVFVEIMQVFQPVMRFFFFESFPAASEWYGKRLAYTRSVASNSMMNFVVGLGDRHCSNILMDKKSAEIVHIDLGIAFEQGKTLRIPERVPFRLTRDIVDGMGSLGVEGTFRKCSEISLKVLRENRHCLFTVFKVLLHDPLFKWNVCTRKILPQNHGASELGDQQDENDGGDERCVYKTEPVAGKYDDLIRGNREAAAAILKIQEKLQGLSNGEILSVPSQVNLLIQEAQDIFNLSQMFEGWAAWV